MESKYSRKRRRRSASRGFSLVELLTVIAIIVLLIGILVPAVSKVRESARNTATKAAIGTLSTGLETFRADQQIGGAYPPSASDWKSGTALTYQVASPYAGLQGTPPPDQFEISGAGLLVWALAGADLSGCPGFKTFRPTNSTYWAQDTDNDATNSAGPGAYALKALTREPMRPRVKPLVDLSKVELTRWNSTAANGGSFELPAEIEAREALGTPLANMPLRNYPMFLDSFGGPILYWRADPSGIQAVDFSPNTITSPQLRGSLGAYHWLDNGPLLSDAESAEQNQDAVILSPRSTNRPHNLRWVLTVTPPGGGPRPDAKLDGFWGYVRNKDVQAKVAAHRPDSFLLISAGADGIFGTGDDIANFEHNGAELSTP